MKSKPITRAVQGAATRELDIKAKFPCGGGRYIAHILEPTANEMRIVAIEPTRAGGWRECGRKGGGVRFPLASLPEYGRCTSRLMAAASCQIGEVKTTYQLPNGHAHDMAASVFADAKRGQQ